NPPLPAALTHILGRFGSRVRLPTLSTRQKSLRKQTEPLQRDERRSATYCRERVQQSTGHDARKRTNGQGPCIAWIPRRSRENRVVGVATPDDRRQGASPLLSANGGGLDSSIF